LIGVLSFGLTTILQEFVNNFVCHI